MTDTTEWDDDILGDDVTEEGVIELTDIVENDSEAPDDEIIIDLTDIVESELEENEDEEDLGLGLELDEDDNDDVEDLFEEEDELSSDGLDFESGDIKDDLVMSDELELPEESELPEEPMLDSEPELAEEPLLEGESEIEEEPVLEEAPAVIPVPVAQPVEINVSQEELEAALERVIEKKFSDKIETILFEVMERVIQKEITQIKNSLQKDLDQIGNG